MTKTLLPIRAAKNSIKGIDQVVLYFSETNRNGQPMERSLAVGPPLEDTRAAYYRDPLGVAILQTLKLFWEMESKVEGLEKEAERLQEEKKGLVRDVADLEKQVTRLKGQVSAASKKG